MEQKNRKELKALLVADPEGWARTRVTIEILRFADVHDAARKLRERAVQRGLEAIVSVERGLLYHTVVLKLTGQKKKIALMVEDLERIEELHEM